MKTDRRTLLRIVIAAFALFLCIYYWDTAAGILSLLFSAAFPLLIGFGIAYAVNITMSFYERHYFPRSGNAALRKSARPVCMLAAYLTVVLILAAVILWTVNPVAAHLIARMEVLTGLELDPDQLPGEGEQEL